RIFEDGFVPRGELIRCDGKTRDFKPFLGGISAGEVDFSRDGKWVVYVSYPDRALWRSRIDGSDRLQLTQPPISAFLPHWSPAGTQISLHRYASREIVEDLLGLRQGGQPVE